MNFKYYLPVANAQHVKATCPTRATYQNMPIVLVRTAKGVFAYEDFCPHRGVPLSEGFIIDGQLQCKYHGWRFDCEDGQNTLVPVKNRPIACKLLSLFAKEAFGLVWISKHENAIIPNLYDTKPSIILEGRIKANLLNALENFLEGSHTHYVHDGLIRSQNSKRYPINAEITNNEDGFQVSYDAEPAKGLVTRLLPKRFQQLNSVSTYIHPGIAVLEFFDTKNRLVSRFEAIFKDEENEVTYFARIFLDVGWLTPFIRPFAKRMFQKIILQDKLILEMQENNLSTFGGSFFFSDETDIVGKYLHAWLHEQNKNLADRTLFNVYW